MNRNRHRVCLLPAALLLLLVDPEFAAAHPSCPDPAVPIASLLMPHRNMTARKPGPSCKSFCDYRSHVLRSRSSTSKAMIIERLSDSWAG